MAAFLSRSVDGVLKRGNRRAALRQFWTTQNASALGITTVGASPGLIESDGLDVWVSNYGNSSVSRVRGSDGTLLGTWTGAVSPGGIVVAMGRIFVTGGTVSGRLYMIDPSQPAGVVTTVASNVDESPYSAAFDGGRLWTTNKFSVSMVTPGATIPWTVSTVSTGFSSPYGILSDGIDIWVTDYTTFRLLRLDVTNGAILQTVTVGTGASFPVFDGSNIWVPNLSSNSVTVVRASSGAVLQTLTGNNLNGPRVAAFDGQRVLVTNSGNNSVSLWKAADLSIAGAFPTGGSTGPYGACSDGVGFWISLSSVGKLARF